MTRYSARELAKVFLPVITRFAKEHGVDNVAAVINELAEVSGQNKRQPKVEIITARPIDKTLVERIAAMMKMKLGVDNLDAHEIVDPTILGGFIARTGDSEIDASVRSKLNQLISHD